jgi:hypothetical protein
MSDRLLFRNVFFPKLAFGVGRFRSVMAPECDDPVQTQQDRSDHLRLDTDGKRGPQHFAFVKDGQ